MTSDSPSSTSADDQIAAHARAAQLVGLPWPVRLRIVQEDCSYAAPDFIELAIGLAREVGIAYAEREKWALLAVAAARRGSSKRAEELEPLAWAVLSDAHRLRGKLKASRAAIVRCRALRGRLVDPLDLAETCNIEAGYWWTVEEPGKAGALIHEALRLARPWATNDVIGSYEIRAGSIGEQAKNWSCALTMLLSALERIDPQAHPRLALGAAHNLASVTIQLGHLDTAMCAILRLRRDYEALAEPTLFPKRDWLLAWIARARGHWREAELRLQSVRESWVRFRLPHRAAQVELELATLAAETHRWPTAAHLAERAARAFSAVGSPREARAAARLLRAAAAKRRSRPG